MTSRILIVITAALMLITSAVQAQRIPIDLKINTLSTLSGDPDISAEFLINDRIGIEPTLLISTGQLLVVRENLADIGYKTLGVGGMLAGKYYFKPQQGGDRFNVGLYAKYKNKTHQILDGSGTISTTNRLAYGFLLGSKFVYQNNILLEFTAGMGRNTNLDSSGDAAVINSLVPFDFVGRIAVGYRFGGGDMASTATPDEKKRRRN